MSAKQTDIRLLAARPGPRGDYVDRPYRAMHGEPEAVGDEPLAVFADAAHTTDKDRVDARVTRENATLHRSAEALGEQFTKFHSALRNAEALPHKERTLNLVRLIEHKLEKLAKSLT